MVILTGIGGWVLARVLGLQTLARVMLGLLCIGKGNLHAVMSSGWYQLSIGQMYFPWILAGVMGIFLFKHRRWPIIMTVLSFVLMFWAGMVWYALPMLILLGLLTLAFAFRQTRGENGKRGRIVVDSIVIRRIVLAGLLTVFLSAATLIPFIADRGYIGTSTIGADDQPGLALVINQYFSGQKFQQLYDNGSSYFSFISPGWFVIFIAVLLYVTLMVRPRSAASHPQGIWRLLVVSYLMIVFITLWGAGINPIITLLYQVVPLVTQFRHVERALGVGSFLIAVTLAIFVDVIWVSLVRHPFWEQRPRLARFGRWINVGAAVILIGSTGLSTYTVLSAWNMYGSGLTPENTIIANCLTWLRAQRGDDEIAMWVQSYPALMSFFRTRIRDWTIGGDFYTPQGPPSTFVQAGNLVGALPKLSLSYYDWDNSWELGLGYKTALPGAPTYNQRPCFFMRDTDEFSYAFSIPAAVLAQKTTVNPDYLGAPQGVQVTPDQLVPADTTPLTSFIRNNDYIGLVVPGNPDQDQVVSVQEVAFPGWKVSVNGLPANLEVVGGQIGVVVPKGTGSYAILFQYRPTLVMISLIISLLTSLFCIVYLLRLDRFIPTAVTDAVLAAGKQAADRSMKFMLNPAVMGTDVITEDYLALPPRPILLPPPVGQALPAPVETGAAEAVVAGAGGAIDSGSENERSDREETGENHE